MDSGFCVHTDGQEVKRLTVTDRQDKFHSKWGGGGVLFGVLFGVLTVRVPYYVGDPTSDPTLENYPYGSS